LQIICAPIASPSPLFRFTDSITLPRPHREALERHLDFARRLRIETRLLNAEGQAHAMVEFARINGVTQIFVLKPDSSRFQLLSAKRFSVMKAIRLARDIQVTVVAGRRTDSR